MARDTLFAELLTPVHRAAPQEVWAELRKDPVSLQTDGTWVVTGYDLVRALSADPRISADNSAEIEERQKAQAEAMLQAAETDRAAHPEREVVVTEPQAQAERVPNFLLEDPPEHNRDRARVMKHFGPPHRPGFVDSLEDSVKRYTNQAIDGMCGRTRIDMVEELAYPLPVSVICDVLGVPHQDEPAFSGWSKTLALLLSPDVRMDPEMQQKAFGAAQAAQEYMWNLVQRRKTDPGDDMLSAMVHDDAPEGRLSDQQIVSNAVVLLIAGHETTVNAIANGILLFLRNPEQAARVRADPDLMPGAFEEILRLEPPVQFRDRTTLSDIPVGDVVIPEGATVQLSYAAANRDPARFPNPDVFDPERADNEHLAFNTGLHYCFGAPLARLEGITALTAFLQRAENPRLVADPPPYRPSPALRGPSELWVEVDGIR